MVEKVKKPRAKKSAKKEENIMDLLPSEQLQVLKSLSEEVGNKCSEILVKAKADCDVILKPCCLKIRSYALIVPLDYQEQDFIEKETDKV